MRPKFCYKDQINQGFNIGATIFVLLVIVLVLIGEHSAHAKGHDNISVETPSYGLYFEGCGVVEDQPDYFMADCGSAEDLGNTIFSGVPKKQQGLFVAVNFRFYQFQHCFQLWNTSRYKGETEYLFMCDGP